NTARGTATSRDRSAAGSPRTREPYARAPPRVARGRPSRHGPCHGGTLTQRPHTLRRVRPLGADREASMHHTVRYATAAVAALLVQVATATAATDPRPFSPAFDRGGPVSCWVSPCPDFTVPAAPLTLAQAEVTAPAPVELSAIYYRPKSGEPEHHRKSSDNDITSVSQFHAGYFVPDGGLGTRFDLGVRGGPLIGRALQLGILADWMYRTEDVSRPITTSIGPGGVPITQTQQLANATVNAFPIMAFAQLNVLDF